MKKDKRHKNGAQSGKKSMLFNICTAGTVIIVLAYFALNVMIGEGVATTAQLATPALLIAVASIINAGICIASFMSKQQRAISVLFLLTSLGIASLAHFVYWFSGYGSGGY